MAIVDAKEHVKARYGRIAEKSGSCCAPAPEAATPCCGGTLQESMSQKVGYSADELATIPGGANLGLGCGNPVALASLAAGETVLDLGSGAGIDCFLAANKVGAKGRVIGVDMTDAMLAKARANATAGGYTNVEFRKGEIEALPVEDGIVDVIISNCVINLSPDKPAVFREAFRVLKAGGRAYISDIVLLKPLPKIIAESAAAYTACVGGAVLKDDYLGAIRNAGFGGAKILSENHYPLEQFANDKAVRDSGLFEGLAGLTAQDIREAAEAIVSVKVELRK